MTALVRSRCRHRFNIAFHLQQRSRLTFHRPLRQCRGACDARPHQNTISSASVAPSCTVAVVAAAQNDWWLSCLPVVAAGSEVRSGKREAVMCQYHVTHAAVASKLAARTLSQDWRFGRWPNYYTWAVGLCAQTERAVVFHGPERNAPVSVRLTDEHGLGHLVASSRISAPISISF
jgi:hypothetical protein